MMLYNLDMEMSRISCENSCDPVSGCCFMKPALEDAKSILGDPTIGPDVSEAVTRWVDGTYKICRIIALAKEINDTLGPEQRSNEY